MHQAAQAAPAGGLVLLFDEFDVLDSPDSSQSAGQTFFPYLRAWMNKAEGVQFVFVIGRRPEDLSIQTMPTFKGTPASQVALLDRRDTEAIIRQSEAEGSLHWTDEAAEAVWGWTQGHPYLTQLLCEAVWKKAHRDEPEEPPTATPEIVATAVNLALVSGANAFVWLWDGLPPAERIVTAAIAEAPQPVISQDELVAILNRSGVHLIFRQLELAPDMLEQWGVLQRVDGGYRFTIPLLRHWVQKQRPLRQVKEELDRVEETAERLFYVALDDYRRGDLEEAERELRRARESNPNHLKAQLLLGQVYLDQDRLPEAVEILEAAYAFDRRDTRHLLVRALLRLAEMQTGEIEQLATYARLLEIAPGQPEVKARQQAILDTQRKRELGQKQTRAAAYVAQEKWEEAIPLYEELLRELPDEAEWQTQLAQARQEARWQQQYNEALGALETGDNIRAQQLLAAVIAEAPAYKQAARYLLQATEGLDMAGLHTEIHGLQTQLQESLPRSQVRKQQAMWGGLGGLVVLVFIITIVWLMRSAAEQERTFSAAQTSSAVAAVNTVDALQNELLTRTYGNEFQQTAIAATLEAALSLLSTPTSTASPTATATATATLTNTPSRTPTATPTIEPTPPLTATLGITWTRPKDDMVMAYVPAGSFLMGSNPLLDPLNRENERPQHEVTLGEFWIDTTEVTNAQYAAFLNAMGNGENGIVWLDISNEDILIREEQGEFRAKDGFDNYPVVGVNWYGADAYCRWVWVGSDAFTGQLPTEAQWEYAARGPESRIYPWGDEFDETRLNYGRTAAILGLAPVGSFPDGASWVGANDLAGNVWEWVADWYGLYRSGPQENPTGPASAAAKVLKGGSWTNERQFVRSAYRGLSRPDGEQSDSGINTLITYGFRCVLSRPMESILITWTPTNTVTPSPSPTPTVTFTSTPTPSPTTAPSPPLPTDTPTPTPPPANTSTPPPG